MDFVKVVFAIILPPVGIFMEVGLRGAFWLNILLTLLGYIPDIVHAVWWVLLAAADYALTRLASVLAYPVSVALDNLHSFALTIVYTHPNQALTSQVRATPAQSGGDFICRRKPAYDGTRAWRCGARRKDPIGPLLPALPMKDRDRSFSLSTMEQIILIWLFIYHAREIIMANDRSSFIISRNDEDA